MKFFTTTIPKHASCAVSDGCPNPGRALFPILSDAGNQVAGRFGIRFAPIR
jgi:hypothetical protein